MYNNKLTINEEIAKKINYYILDKNLSKNIIDQKIKEIYKFEKLDSETIEKYNRYYLFVSWWKEKNIKIKKEELFDYYIFYINNNSENEIFSAFIKYEKQQFFIKEKAKRDAIDKKIQSKIQNFNNEDYTSNFKSINDENNIKIDNAINNKLENEYNYSINFTSSDDSNNKNNDNDEFIENNNESNLNNFNE